MKYLNDAFGAKDVYRQVAELFIGTETICFGNCAGCKGSGASGVGRNSFCNFVGGVFSLDMTDVFFLRKLKSFGIFSIKQGMEPKLAEQFVMTFS